ncbi:MAG: hypothetical protein JW753_09795 [Dehalococcoidia bacterium]|nr:hypothetical protein [Dehalococcoidia bacterium]
MLKRDSTTIRVNGKIVGEVRGNKFVKRLRASKHMLREPKGWAVDVQSLDDAEWLGARDVEIEDTETGAVYTASIERIRSKGFVINRGFGRQICLCLQSWSVRHPGEPQQLTLALGVMP